MEGIHTKLDDDSMGKAINRMRKRLSELLKEIDNKENEIKINEKLWNKFINDEAVISYDSFEDMEFLIDYLHEQGFRELFGFDGESLKRINLQNVWNLHNCIRVRDVEDKRIVFHEIDDGFIQQCFEIITFKELFNLNPPKQLSDYTNEELLEELENRLK
ncbi:TPA: hypothetical protein PTV74_003199 [Clostridium botulinum]|nr:hypothetical protein [Clostridium botulinum]HDK7206354.1 hypothetical protein [Clostridium botulinum]HDK7210090.1 hypothetical protein [Clostridium botulinum]HDK7265539.1 hypothetical protein [Clostridium botulinum]HDK7269387.1 hypothetical protein [Clostridium botulinum]